VSLAPILRLVKEHATQELWGIAGAVVFRFLKAGTFNAESTRVRESSEARAEGRNVPDSERMRDRQESLEFEIADPPR